MTTEEGVGTYVCPGSEQHSDRVHSSGALVCPFCYGVYFAAGMTLPKHMADRSGQGKCPCCGGSGEHYGRISLDCINTARYRILPWQGDAG